MEGDHSALTLNLGLRVDYQTMAWTSGSMQSRYHASAIRWSTSCEPRRQAALWQPRRRLRLGSRRATARSMVARGGYGTACQVFFNGNQGQRARGAAAEQHQHHQPSVSRSRSAGAIRSTFVSTAPPSVGIMANDLKNAPTRTGQRRVLAAARWRTPRINVTTASCSTRRDLPLTYQHQSADHADRTAHARLSGARSPW